MNNKQKKRSSSGSRSLRVQQVIFLAISIMIILAMVLSMISIN